MGGKGSGRTPRPAAVRLLNGRAAGRDSGGRPVAAPRPFRRCAPETPAGLTENEVWLWDQTVPELERLQLLTPAHIGVLRSYLLMWDQALAAHQAACELGPLIDVQTKTGSAVQANPALREVRLAVAELRACARELGCTPVAESAITGRLAGDTPRGGGGGGGGAPNPFSRYG